MSSATEIETPLEVTWMARAGEPAHAFPVGRGWMWSVCTGEHWNVLTRKPTDPRRCVHCERILFGEVLE